MNEALHGFLAAAVIIGVAVLILGGLIGWYVRTKERTNDLIWRPRQIRAATLAYSEKTFVSRFPFPMGARVDRAYRLQNMLVLAEFKSREHRTAYFSDVVELSAQKLAIEGSASERVAEIGYVVTEHPKTQERSATPVKMLGKQEMLALARRYHALIRGEVAPRKANQSGLCSKCPFARECKPPVLNGTG